MTNADTMTEKHYSIAELAKMWSLSVECVRRLVIAEPDIGKVTKGKRTTYRIPESVARRIYTKMLTGTAGRAA